MVVLEAVRIDGATVSHSQNQWHHEIEVIYPSPNLWTGLHIIEVTVLHTVTQPWQSLCHL